MLFFLPVNTSTKTGADTPRLNRKANRVYVYDSPLSDFKDLIGNSKKALSANQNASRLSASVTAPEQNSIRVL
jgi:hypothetical protein